MSSYKITSWGNLGFGIYAKSADFMTETPLGTVGTEECAQELIDDLKWIAKI